MNFQEEDDELEEELEFQLLREFHHETRVHALTWNPETSLSVLPKVVSFASAGADYKLRVFTSDLVSTHTLQVNRISNRLQDSSLILNISLNSCWNVCVLWNLPPNTNQITCSDLQLGYHPILSS